MQRNTEADHSERQGGGGHLGEHVVPLVDHVSEVLVVQLVGLVPSVEASGSEDGQEARVVGALLDARKRWR